MLASLGTPPNVVQPMCPFPLRDSLLLLSAIPPPIDIALPNIARRLGTCLPTAPFPFLQLMLLLCQKGLLLFNTPSLLLRVLLFETFQPVDKVQFLLHPLMLIVFRLMLRFDVLLSIQHGLDFLKALPVLRALFLGSLQESDVGLLPSHQDAADHANADVGYFTPATMHMVEDS